MTDPLFLDDEELRTLTGRSIKRLQIEALKQMLVPFRVNAIGKPIVTRAAALGLPPPKQEKPQGWSPRVMAQG
jgi:hypothetical protein